MPKIINSFFYSDDDEVVCINLYTEKERRVPAQAFQNIFTKFCGTPKTIFLANMEGSIVSPVYKIDAHPMAANIADMDLDEQISFVYRESDRLIKARSQSLKE